MNFFENIQKFNFRVTLSNISLNFVINGEIFIFLIADLKFLCKFLTMTIEIIIKISHLLLIYTK